MDAEEEPVAVRGRGGGPLPPGPPVGRAPAGNQGPIPPANKVFTILMFAALFLLARSWKEKSRTSTPILDAVTPAEIAAVVSLLASLIYLIPAQLF